MGLSSFDVFRKLPKDIDTSTATGGFFSVIAFIVNFLKKFGFLLFMAEFRMFMSQDIIREMIINNDDSKLIQVNIDFTFFNSPCSGSLNFKKVLGIYQENDIGYSVTDIPITISKYRISSKDSLIGRTQKASNYSERISNFKDQLADKEGCQLKGNFKVQKVRNYIKIDSWSFFYFS